MPTYCYKCPTCDYRMEESHTMEMAQFRPPCPKPNCEAVMQRDWKAESPAIRTDPEYCQADQVRYIEQAAAHKQVDEPTLSRSLAMVPGIPKARMPDGKTYATFRNRAHRREILKQIGAVDLAS